MTKTEAVRKLLAKIYGLDNFGWDITVDLQVYEAGQKSVLNFLASRTIDDYFGKNRKSMEAYALMLKQATEFVEGE